MGKYYICGGKKLQGETTVDGAKNAVLPILAATVLNASVNCIHNCPMILDSKIMVEILTAVGCKVICDGNTIHVDSSYANSYEVPEKQVKEMRSSIIFLGSMIGRFKKAIITYPGGCELGPRPIDLHLKALKQMGISINEANGFIVCEAKEILGTNINLDFPSVGATENIMLAAVLAKGRTVINNAAKEPEIVDLQNFLIAMGAKVYGAGTDKIFIDGVEKLHEVEYSVMPDRIVAGTLLVAGAITKGEIVVNDVNPSHIYSILSKLRECGCIIVEEPNSIYLKAPNILNSVDFIRTHPYPGFPTDMQPQFMTLLTLAKGTSIIIETVFESRYKHVSELMRMGANISLDGRTAIIKGVDHLRSANVSAMDLRGGAALILAGLAASGQTIVDNSKHIERGYESIHSQLVSLGANINFIA